VCYEEKGEGGFKSDLSTSVFSSFFSSFFAFLITFFASFLTSFFLCFDFFPFPAIASSRAARQTTYTFGLFFDRPGRRGKRRAVIAPLTAESERVKRPP
jgi:hypothetical protein